MYSCDVAKCELTPHATPTRAENGAESENGDARTPHARAEARPREWRAGANRDRHSLRLRFFLSAPFRTPPFCTQAASRRNVTPNVPCNVRQNVNPRRKAPQAKAVAERATRGAAVRRHRTPASVRIQNRLYRCLSAVRMMHYCSTKCRMRPHIPTATENTKNSTFMVCCHPPVGDSEM